MHVDQPSFSHPYDMLEGALGLFCTPGSQSKFKAATRIKEAPNMFLGSSGNSPEGPPEVTPPHIACRVECVKIRIFILFRCHMSENFLSFNKTYQRSTETQHLSLVTA